MTGQKCAFADNAVIVDAVRTPIGEHRGALARTRPDDMVAHLLQAMVHRNRLDPATVDEVVIGCANQAGEDCRNVARMAALLAGFPYQVPACTVNRLCGSGLDAITFAARAIWVGAAQVVVAGGVESMSRAPWALAKPESGYASGNCTLYDTAVGWRFPNPRILERFPHEKPGETAENLVEHWQVTREEQDRIAFDSHRKAIAAQQAGAFDDEIVPIEVLPARGKPVRFARDEGPRHDATLEALARLPPMFRTGGTVTAGNCSKFNDGAAALLVMAESRARALGLPLLARVGPCAVSGVDPRLMGAGPIPAVNKLLAQTGLSIDTFDLIEINEAFAVQQVVCIRELHLDPGRLNVNGGALALGHPLGASGARIAATLVHAMHRRQARRGLAAIGVGVGQGEAMLLEAP